MYSNYNKNNTNTNNTNSNTMICETEVKILFTIPQEVEFSDVKKNFYDSVKSEKSVVTTDELVTREEEITFEPENLGKLCEEILTEKLNKETVKAVNSNSFKTKKNGTNKKWSVEETDLFFELLGKYGTDFEIIATHFKKTRK